MLRSIFLWSLLSAAAIAQDFDVSIQYRLTAKESHNAYAWQVMDEGFKPFPFTTDQGGRVVVLERVPKRLIVTLAVTATNGTLKVQTKPIDFGSMPPAPDNPAPVPPGPGPGPVVPTDRFDNVGQVAAAAAAKFSSDNRAKAKPTAAVYRSIAAQYAAGALPSYSAAKLVLDQKLNETWGVDGPTWTGEFKPAIGTAWQKFIVSGSASRDDVVEFLNAVAAGLETVN